MVGDRDRRGGREERGAAGVRFGSQELEGKFIPAGRGERVNYPSYLQKLKERKKE